ncbi:MAG TPA: A/G-specific adenine glycosylase [Spirochaetia bacterium]|nr:A/G-specific adenine glycosylase [Spirochaetia bacterium]
MAELPIGVFGDYAHGILPDASHVEAFRTAVLEYFRLYGRPFPWRDTRDPYRIFVSELMLQQTQTERVVPKYTAFIERFSSFEVLARASLREVYELWRGLGYNRRAKALRDAAARVVAEFGGALPREITQLESLPGVGPYTARAVSVFAFDRAEVFIETNIRRVFIHCFFPGRDEVHDRQIIPLVEATLDRGAPRIWYYALMDVGAGLRRVTANPNRRSVHYVRQAPFADSSRQLRGRILASLASGTLEAKKLAGDLGAPLDSVERSLEALEREGLVVKEEAGYTIPDARWEGGGGEPPMNDF